MVFLVRTRRADGFERMGDQENIKMHFHTEFPLQECVRYYGGFEDRAFPFSTLHSMFGLYIGHSRFPE